MKTIGKPSGNIEKSRKSNNVPMGPISCPPAPGMVFLVLKRCDAFPMVAGGARGARRRQEMTEERGEDGTTTEERGEDGTTTEERGEEAKSEANQ